jgi:hypothetical protein
MALVYGNDATEFFFSLLNNAFITEVPFSRNQASLITRADYKRNHQVNFFTHKDLGELGLLFSLASFAFTSQRGYG